MWGWGSGKVIGLIVAAVVLAVAWVEVERRSAVPLIDMKMMRRTAVWTNNLVALLFGVGMYASLRVPARVRADTDVLRLRLRRLASPSPD